MKTEKFKPKLNLNSSNSGNHPVLPYLTYGSDFFAFEKVDLSVKVQTDFRRTFITTRRSTAISNFVWRILYRLVIGKESNI